MTKGMKAGTTRAKSSDLSLASLDRRLSKLEKANKEIRKAFKYGADVFSTPPETSNQPVLQPEN